MSLLLARNVVLIPLQKRKRFLAATDHLAKHVQPNDRFTPFSFTASIIRTPPVQEDAMIIDGQYGIISPDFGDHIVPGHFEHAEDTEMTALIAQVSFFN